MCLLIHAGIKVIQYVSKMGLRSLVKLHKALKDKWILSLYSYNNNIKVSEPVLAIG